MDESPFGTQPESEPPQSSRTAAAPKLFHLLWDEDLDELHEVLAAVRDRHSEVVAQWYELYELHFGEQRTLSQVEFRSIFEPAMLKDQEFLLRKDMDGYAASILKMTDELVQRQVPLPEIIASLELFEETARGFFPKGPVSPQIYSKLDKLSHVRIILLVDAYSHSKGASTAARIRELEMEARRVPARKRTRFHGLVGSTPAMREIYQRIEAAGRTRGTVLVVGESGSGKELVASAIHECGPRSTAPFVALNCAALPSDLIESELFGHRRGAFSGASSDYLGLFRAAEGGTLFLDEVTEMTPSTQAKLLRAIQEHRVRPMGSTQEIAVDTRVIASTNRNPEEALARGQLREDLYYRLHASVLRVLPLRERVEDIKELVEHFIAFFNEKFPRTVPVAGIDQAALEAMQRYSWPGNVRELSNAIEGAFTFGTSPLISLDDLPPPISGNVPAALAPPRPAELSFANSERDLIVRALEMAEWNKARASRILHISRKRLYARIAKYGLE